MKQYKTDNQLIYEAYQEQNDFPTKNMFDELDMQIGDAIAHEDAYELLPLFGKVADMVAPRNIHMFKPNTYTNILHLASTIMGNYHYNDTDKYYLDKILKMFDNLKQTDSNAALRFAQEFKSCRQMLKARVSNWFKPHSK